MFEPMNEMRRRGALVMAALGLLLVWGCEGTHGFAPVTVGPEIVELFAPGAVESGDDLPVGVRAEGLVRVDSIVTTVRIGDYEETQVAQQAGILPQFVAGFEFSLPASLSDTLGIVEAYAVDAQMNVGPLTQLTIRTIDTDGPDVAVSTPNTDIGLGTQVPITITASDNVGLSQIGFQILNADLEVLAEVLVPEGGTEVERKLLYSVPMDLPLGPAGIVGIAIDHEGLVAYSDPILVNLVDVDLPEVEVVTPSPGDSEPAQEPLFTQVQIRDNDAVDSVRIDGVAHRGDRTLGTDTVVVRFQPLTVDFAEPVMDTLLQRFLTPAADSSKENAFIRAFAYVRHGNVSSDSVEIGLLIDEVPPNVQIDTPVVNQIHAIGDSIRVQTYLRELPAPIRSGVKTLTLEGLAFRGDMELGTFHTVERFTPRTITFDPPRADEMIVTRYLPATAVSTSEYAYIIATATDAWGNSKADTVRIRLVFDTIAPEILIHEPTNGTTRPAGSPVTVSATIFEGPGFDESGVSRVVIDGVSYRPGGVVVQKFFPFEGNWNPSEPSVDLSVPIAPTPDVTLEDVWIRIRARDYLGNTSTDSVMITLTAPPPAPPAPVPPEIGMADPWPKVPGGPGDDPGAVREGFQSLAWIRTGGTGRVGTGRRRPSGGRGRLRPPPPTGNREGGGRHPPGVGF